MPTKKPDSREDQPRKPEETSEGEYGGLKDLGPGGGHDIADAADTDDIDPDDIKDPGK